MAVNSSKDQTRAEIRSCTTYCATTCNQQPKQSTEISIITTFFFSQWLCILLMTKKRQKKALVHLIVILQVINNSNKPRR